MTSCIPTGQPNRGAVNRAINDLETITYHKHHYVRKTGLKKVIKELFDVPTDQSETDNRWCEKCGFDHVWERLYDHTPIQPTGQSKDWLQCTNCHELTTAIIATDRNYNTNRCGSCGGSLEQYVEPQPNTGQSKEFIDGVEFAETVFGTPQNVYKALAQWKGDSITEFMHDHAPSPLYEERLAATQALSSAKASGNDTEPLPPQPNTDSLREAIFNKVADLSDYSDEYNAATDYFIELFNKYARDAVIAELDGILKWSKSGAKHRLGETGQKAVEDMVQYTLRELQEQRAKLKEEGK